jgi:hypothetical protein
MAYSKDFPFYVSADAEGYVPHEDVEPSKNLRSGITWLLKHQFTMVDYDEMLRQLKICEKENRYRVSCGCESCPSLILCMDMFDARCPDTTLDKEVLLIDRPWCCGSPMIKDGHMNSGEFVLQAYQCKYCDKRTPKFDKALEV